MRTRTTSHYSFHPVPKTAAPPAAAQSSPWHSPVPYLFGGLAAMLRLIAFALILLACSYWKPSDGEDGGSAAKGGRSSDERASPAFEEKVLVIMAGDARPTFLATLTSGRAKSMEIEMAINSRNQSETSAIRIGEESHRYWT